jgi:anthranilate phosphoribosyltransferase
MKDLLIHLFEYKTISKEEARSALKQIASGEINASQMAAFMTVYMMRSITVEELEGFRDAMLDLCLPVHLDGYNAIDVCGTGGDGKDTFNISTLAAFVVAGTGQKVAKHGNYGVSSSCGSSNVMNHLGYQFTNDEKVLVQQIEEANICFMHAPLFHPAMKNVAPIRKDLGVKTFFNMLGPMVNPAFPPNQLVGVFNLELARLYGYLYQNSGKNYSIIHALDGYDEVSLTGSFKVISQKGEQLLTPEDIKLSRLSAEALYGGHTVEEAGTIFMDVLQGKGTPAQTDVVCANAALGIQCARPELSISDALAMAKESLQSGKALKSLKALLQHQAV